MVQPQWPKQPELVCIWLIGQELRLIHMDLPKEGILLLENHHSEIPPYDEAHLSCPGF